ncbi:MAG TPA: recombinase family protein, partial [Ktedonobacteraceae bacterium]|nr:recombinase family protein [Ktedonobacteraceae bacterium]
MSKSREKTESTSRQYALRERALALGWSEERIVAIAQDLGHWGASTTDRLGFQRLVAEVGLGQVGLVLTPSIFLLLLHVFIETGEMIVPR